MDPAKNVPTSLGLAASSSSPCWRQACRLPEQFFKESDTGKRAETRQKIIDAATQILLNESLAASSLDTICERAGITKKAFYYHFESKDALLAVVVAGMKPHYEAALHNWADDAGPDANMNSKLISLLKAIDREANRPTWKGCYFMKTIAELGHLPGHPARKPAAEANASMEQWIAPEGHRAAEPVASHMLMMINGLIMSMLVHLSSRSFEQALAAIDYLVPSRKGSIPTSRVA